MLLCLLVSGRMVPAMSMRGPHQWALLLDSPPQSPTGPLPMARRQQRLSLGVFIISLFSLALSFSSGLCLSEPCTGEGEGEGEETRG